MRAFRSNLLIPSLPPIITLPVLFSVIPFRSIRCLLHLRGSVIILKFGTHREKFIPLSNSSRPKLVGLTSVTVRRRYRFVFETARARDKFYDAASQATQRTGARGEGYDILEVIGKGSSANVYKVRRRADNELLAMKAIRKEFAFASDVRLSRVAAEHSALMDAKSRNATCIVKLVDIYETDEHMCFISELCSYGSFFRILKRIPGGYFPEDVARLLFAEAIIGLEECHRMGYLHRDIKPSNFVITKTGHVRLADFGLAKLVAGQAPSEEYPEGQRGVTYPKRGREDNLRLNGRASSFVGTRKYLPPEVWRLREDPHMGYDTKADLWAIGVTLLSILGGNNFNKQAFPRNDNRSCQEKRCRTSSPPQGQTPAHAMGEEVGDMLRGLLNSDADQRLDLNAVKSHRWLKDIDWSRTKDEARRDVPRPMVIEYVKSIASRAANKARPADARGPHAEVGLTFTMPYQSKSCGRFRTACIRRKYEMLGFSFI